MRRRTALGAALAGAAIAVWVPSLIASRYADGPGGTEHVLGHPLRGWEFVADAVRASRGARLGSRDGALAVARDQIWTGPPARAVDVRLVWTRGPFGVEVPDGGTAPDPARAVVRPASRFSWIVIGRVRKGPRQMIGVLDYRTGQVVWNIRPLPAAGAS
ncbi:MAG: hypothetical protein IT200_01475 [Thermoleophilia bacterium]|nr:hypothetical protein [Thermoleophilia bacterium]